VSGDTPGHAWGPLSACWGLLCGPAAAVGLRGPVRGRPKHGFGLQL